MRVLVVDDCRDTTTSVSHLLRFWGHESAVAKDGAAAISLTVDFGPAVPFAVVKVAATDGHEVARQRRETQRLEHSMLVAVTGIASPPGAFDLYLLKPVAPYKLKLLLDSLGDGGRAKGACREHQQDPLCV